MGYLTFTEPTEVSSLKYYILCTDVTTIISARKVEDQQDAPTGDEKMHRERKKRNISYRYYYKGDMNL